jgi:hypothetical protein
MNSQRIAPLLVSAALLFAGCSSNSAEPSGSDTQAQTSMPSSSADSEAAKYPGFSEDIKSDDITFNVKTVTCGQKQIVSGAVELDAEGQYCFVQLTVTNNTDEEYVFFGGDQDLYDSDSARYEMYASGAVFIPESRSLGERIPVGKTISAILPYDIPVSAFAAGMLLRADSTSEGELMLFQNREP